MYNVLAETPLRGTLILFVTFGEKMLTEEVLRDLGTKGFTLLRIEVSQYKTIEKLRDAFQCKRPLVFADNKYILQSGAVGVSGEKPDPYEKPNFYWSPDCIFVATKL